MSREKTHKIKRTLTLSQDYWRDELAALELFWKNRPYGSFQFVTRKVLWRINCTKFTIKWWQISKHTWKTTGGLLMPCRFPLFVFPFAYLPLSQKQLRNRLINRRQRWVNNSMHTNQPHSCLENFLWNPLGVSGALQSLYRCPSSMGISYKDLSSSFSCVTNEYSWPREAKLSIRKGEALVRILCKPSNHERCFGGSALKRAAPLWSEMIISGQNSDSCAGSRAPEQLSAERVTPIHWLAANKHGT